MSIQKLETICEPAKETAKKIRAALKVNFPNTKFSVRTDVYSGGSSVNVSWTDLPLVDEVETVVNRFKSGSFDGMTDMYETTGYIIDGKRYVGAKYIFTSRKLSDERKELIKTWMKENYSEVNENSYDYYYHFNKAEELMIKQEQTKQPEPVQENVLENNQIIENTENIQVELIHNKEKNGLELKFTGCPSEGTRQLLKDNGYKWSKYNKVWYCKQSETALMFAESFVSAFNEPIENEESELETITNEVEQNLINDSELIGRKVFGQWGVMAGWDNGTITGETFYNEVIIKWEDGHEEYFELKNLVYVHENTNIDAVGVYLMPIEESKQPIINEVPEVEPVTEETPNKPNNSKGKVLDFNSKFKQKQEEKQANQFFDHFVNNILPYMNKEEQLKLINLYQSGNMEEIEQYTNMLSMKCAILAAKEEFKHK